MNKFKGFNSLTSKNIIKEVNGRKFFVSVPTLALYTEAELSSIDEPTTFVNGNPVSVEKRRGVDASYVTRPFQYEADPVTFVNGEPIKNSKNNRSTVMLPLSKIIDLHNDGSSIYILRKDDILTIAEFLTDILNRLDNAVDQSRYDFVTYIEDFYNKVLATKNKSLKKLISDNNEIFNNEVVGLGAVDLMSDKNDIESHIENNINIDDLLV